MMLANVLATLTLPVSAQAPVIVFVAVCSLLPFVMMAIMVRFQGRSRTGVVFGVSLPLEQASSPEVLAGIRRFRLRSRLAFLLGGAAVIAAAFTSNLVWITAATSVALFLSLGLSVACWQVERRRLHRPAHPIPVTRSARLAPPAAGTGAIVAGFSALLPLAATAVWLKAHWSRIPASWPQHWNAQGIVNGWGHRDGGHLFHPLLFGLVLVMIMGAVGALQSFAAGPQVAQRRRMLAPLAAMAWLFALLCSGMALVPLLQPLTEQQILAGVMVHALLLGAVAIWALFRVYSATQVTSPAAAPYDGTPDAMWRAGGMIYVNPEDAAVIVPRRFGLGWTLNFGRPAAWLYLGGLMLLIILSVAAALMS